MTKWRTFHVPAHRSFAFGIPGVYALYSEGRLVYVGHTSDLRRRIGSHARRLTFDRFKVRLQFDRLERQRLEQRLMFRLRPPANATKPRCANLPDFPGFSQKYWQDALRRRG